MRPAAFVVCTGEGVVSGHASLGRAKHAAHLRRHNGEWAYVCTGKNVVLGLEREDVEREGRETVGERRRAW